MRYPAAKAVLFAGVVLAGATAAASSVGRGVVAADLALVLAVDVSSSVTTERWELQRQGYAAAFRSSEVLHAIRSGPTGVIAVTMVQWSDMAHQQQTVPWRLIRTTDEAEAFAREVEVNERAFATHTTAIAGAIKYSMHVLESGPAALRRVIDVSGDGESNDGPSPGYARDEVTRRGVTINGLPILAWATGLEDHYLSQVVGGPGNFLIAATYDTFAAAVRRKIVLEIAHNPHTRRFAVMPP